MLRGELSRLNILNHLMERQHFPRGDHFFEKTLEGSEIPGFQFVRFAAGLLKWIPVHRLGANDSRAGDNARQTAVLHYPDESTLTLGLTQPTAKKQRIRLLVISAQQK